MKLKLTLLPFAFTILSFVLLSTSPITSSANEQVLQVECLGLTVTSDADSLYFEFDDGKSFLISRDDPESSNLELQGLLEHLDSDEALPSSVRKAISTKTPTEIINTIEKISNR